MILRINIFFNINCRRKFQEVKVPASLVGFAREIQSHFIFHCYFKQLRISNKYFTSPLWGSPKHNSLHTKKPQQTQTPPKQKKVHCDRTSIYFQLFARELPKLCIQQTFLPIFLLGVFLLHTVLNRRCMFIFTRLCSLMSKVMSGLYKNNSRKVIQKWICVLIT